LSKKAVTFIIFFCLAKVVETLNDPQKIPLSFQIMIAMEFSTNLSREYMQSAYIKFMTQKNEGVKAERDLIC
jgi:hypothetical protein